MSLGRSKFMTCFTCGMSRPRAATCYTVNHSEIIKTTFKCITKQPKWEISPVHKLNSSEPQHFLKFLIKFWIYTIQMPHMAKKVQSVNMCSLVRDRPKP